MTLLYMIYSEQVFVVYLFPFEKEKKLQKHRRDQHPDEYGM